MGPISPGIKKEKKKELQLSKSGRQVTSVIIRAKGERKITAGHTSVLLRGFEENTYTSRRLVRSFLGFANRAFLFV